MAVDSILSSPLGPPTCEKDAKALQFIEGMTRNADTVQERVLAEILSRNAETEWLKRFKLGGATDRKTFKSKIPVIMYEDVQPEIQRIANGDRSAILSVHPISEFLTRLSIIVSFSTFKFESSSQVYVIMDKTWISKPRNTVDYLIGLSHFLDFAFENGAVGDTIRCPCPKCGFLKWKTRDIAYDHLLRKPFPLNYVIWNLHGEKQVFESTTTEDVMQETCHYENPMDTMMNDAFGHYRQQVNNEGVSEPCGADEILNEGPREDHSFIDEFLKDVNQKLYEGSNYTKLEFIIKLYHIKVLCRLSEKAMTLILNLLRDAFEEVKLPPSVYESKKIINKLGLNYTKIDACPNDCMLYLGDGEKDLDACKHCGKSRWKPNKKNKVAAKVLRYFPLKPRLKRLFRCCKTAKHMIWHALEGYKDGLIRHPRDGEAWRTFDSMHPDFASDPRNVRLGLATDGFNPFGRLSSTHSIWPVFLTPYNLPPWMCMKHTSFILSMIIPGKYTPGNNIDVYLLPLVEELKELWDSGVETFDSSSNETFRMRAALMWTISDFPGLGILSGWNTHTVQGLQVEKEN